MKNRSPKIGLLVSCIEITIREISLINNILNQTLKYVLDFLYMKNNPRRKLSAIVFNNFEEFTELSAKNESAAL